MSIAVLHLPAEHAAGGPGQAEPQAEREPPGEQACAHGERSVVDHGADPIPRRALDAGVDAERVRVVDAA